MKEAAAAFAVIFLVAARAFGAGDPLFEKGLRAARFGNHAVAAEAFRASALAQPSSERLQNLGIAEWLSGRTGPAVLAWEQALWLDSFNQAARNNLKLARKTAQLESPRLRWHEVVSSWLPMNSWAWITGVSLWVSVAAGMLPGILRHPKAAWHQALAAVGLMIFLLGVPAQAGIHTRSSVGFILNKETPLRLTPTADAQTIMLLAAGEPARLARVRGKYALIRTNQTLGWVERQELGLVSERMRP